MNPQRLRLGLILAAMGMLLALVLPLSTEAAAVPLSAWPIGLALTLGAALLFAAGAWRGGSSRHGRSPASPVPGRAVLPSATSAVTARSAISVATDGKSRSAISLTGSAACIVEFTSSLIGPNPLSAS